MALDKEVLKERLNKAKGSDSQDEVAAKLNMTQGNVSKLLSGNQQPTLETIYLFAQAYNVSVDWLLGLSNDSKITKEKEVTYAAAVEAIVEIEGNDRNYSYPVDEYDYSLTISDPLLVRLLRKGIALYNADKEAYNSWRENKLSMFSEATLINAGFWEKSDADALFYPSTQENQWLKKYKKTKEESVIPF